MPDRRILVAADGSEQGAGRDLARRAERLRTGGLQVDTRKVADVVEADLVGAGSAEMSPPRCSTCFVDHSSSFPDSLYPRAL